MQKFHSWRSAVSYSMVAALALHFVGGLTAISTVHAADASLVISEINWAGSSASPSDTWVEVENKGGNIFSDQLSLCTDTGVVFTLPSASILPNNFLLIRNSVPFVDPSTLGAFAYASALATDLSALPTSATNLSLVDGACGDPAAMVLDTVMGQGSSVAPFKGEQNVNGVYASMQRVGTNGNLDSSWVDSAATKTIGQNIRPDVINQYGTPAEAFATLATPENVTVLPGTDGNTTQNTNLTIMGTVDPSTYAIELYQTVHGSSPAVNTFLFPPVKVTPDAQNHFSVSTNVPTLANGVYDYSVRALKGALAIQSDRSALTPVISEKMSGTTLVVYPTVGILGTPNFSTPVSPAHTMAMQVDVTGIAPGAQNVIILNNGEYFETVPTNGEGSFAFTGILTANAQTTFNAISVDGTNDYSTISTPLIVWQDSTAPQPLHAAFVSQTVNTQGNLVTLTGQAGAVTVDPNDGALSVFIYADVNKTQVLAGPIAVNPDGSFPTTTLNATTFATVYGTVKDQAGNESIATLLGNPLNVGGSTTGLSPHVVDLQSQQATLGWNLVTVANHYLIKYKVAGGTYSVPMAECLGVTTCTPQATITGLNPSTQYVFAVAAVDVYGNVGQYSELTFTTTTPAPVITTAVATTTPPVTTTATTPATRNTDTVTTTPIPAAATPSPTPSASPDTGNVQSASTDASRNWTPWIVLLILLAIALLATIGYFYWFGGEVGEEALLAAAAAKKRQDDEQTKSTKSTSSSKSDTKTDKGKRW